MRSARTVFGQTLVLESFTEKLKGLMFEKRVRHPLLFVFSKQARSENAIHSFFCPAFDAIFIDEKRIVVGVEEVRSTRAFICPEKPFKYLIETFPGHARKLKLSVGKKLVLPVG